MNLLKRFVNRTNLIRNSHSFKSNKAEPPKEFNETRLLGTVTKVFEMPQRTFGFLIKTYDDLYYYENHKVIVPGFEVENVPNVKEGQKVFVMGKMRLKYFSKGDGLKGAEVHVTARDIFICDSGNDAIEIKDLNVVQLYAQICHEIVHQEKVSTFILATHYNLLIKDGNQSEEVNFIKIFVTDEALRQYVRNHLNRLDRVRIEGILKYKTQLDDKARKKHFGYVSATKIIKMCSAQEQNRSRKSPEDSLQNH